MALRILTDSSCDLELGEQEALRITILPIRVYFGEEVYTEGENLTKPAFYSMLAAADTLPKTAQITPAEFEDAFRPLVEAGDEILLLPISRELSGTYQSALLAKEAFPGASIHVVDTLTTTFGLSLLIRQAVALRDQGMTGEEAARELTALVPRLRLFAVVDDLKYLKMGGRLSSAGAVVGSLLNIKPLISIAGGKVVSIAKARGLKAAFRQIADLVAAEGVDAAYPAAYGHSNDPAIMEELRAVIDEAGFGPVFTVDIGPVVGTHIGPGCTGFAFVKK